jgi:hypothetical protein
LQPTSRPQATPSSSATRPIRRLNEAVRGRSKVILTCRTHYFTTQAAEREGIAGSMPRGGELFAELEGRRNYSIVYLEPFSQEQIREFVHRHYPEFFTPALGDCPSA